MKCCIMRKVPYRLAGTSRLLWGIVLAQREGLTLLFVRKPDDNHSHALVVATENPGEKVFEDVNASRFALEAEDLSDVGTKLDALGDILSNDEFRKLFQTDEPW